MRIGTFYVYLHCRPDGTPFYVGKGKGGRSHELKSGRNNHHRHIVAKYGRENIEILVFARASEEDALSDEIAWISVLRGDGYTLANRANGGDGARGCHFTPERLDRQRAALAGNRNAVGNKSCVGRVLSKETRDKIAKANHGKTPWLGRRHSEETKAKLSAAHTGKRHGPRSEEAKTRIAAAVAAWWKERKASGL